MIVKMIQDLRNIVEVQINRTEAQTEKRQESLKKELEEIKNRQSSMNNTITETKSTREGTNSRMTEAEERKSEWKVHWWK